MTARAEDAAQAGEVWQEADNVLLLCITPGVIWRDWRGDDVPWNAPTIARPLSRLLDAKGNLALAAQEGDAGALAREAAEWGRTRSHLNEFMAMEASPEDRQQTLVLAAQADAAEAARCAAAAQAARIAAAQEGDQGEAVEAAALKDALKEAVESSRTTLLKRLATAERALREYERGYDHERALHMAAQEAIDHLVETNKLRCRERDEWRERAEQAGDAVRAVAAVETVRGEAVERIARHLYLTCDEDYDHRAITWAIAQQRYPDLARHYTSQARGILRAIERG